MQVKSLFVRVCVDTTNCWVNLWEQRFTLRENGWLLQCKPINGRKSDSVIKGFPLFDPSPIPEFLLRLTMCSLVLAQWVNFWTPWNRRIGEFSMSQKDTFEITLLFFFWGIHLLHQQQLSSHAGQRFFQTQFTTMPWKIAGLLVAFVLESCNQTHATFQRRYKVFNRKACLSPPLSGAIPSAEH